MRVDYGHAGKFTHRCARHGRASRLLLLGVLVVIQPISPAHAHDPHANPAPVPLGAAGAFTVMAAAAVSNTGDTVISADTGVGGNLGLSPNLATSVTGFPPGVVEPPGAIHAGDALASAARTAAGTAYTNAAGRPADHVFTNEWDLVNQTFKRGVYNDATSLALSGTMTLDAQGDPDAVFIFQAGSTLGTSANSTVALINGAQACNVFWQVGSSATLGANSTFNGTILAHTSATVGNLAAIEGRVLAGAIADSGAVTLSDDQIHTPACAPISGVALAPLFGSMGSAVALAAFLAGGGVVVARRRMRPALCRIS